MFILNKNPSPSPSPPHSPIQHQTSLLFSPPQHFFPFNNSTSFLAWETMRRRPHTLLISFLFILLFAAFSLHLSRNAVSGWRPESDLDDRPNKLNRNSHVVVRTSNDDDVITYQTRRVSSINFKESLSTVSILLPDWEILVITSTNTLLPSSNDRYHCLFRNNAMTPAKFSGVLPFTNRTSFKCNMPETVRRRRMFSQPKLVTGTLENESSDPSPVLELIRWNFMVYESFSTDDDVVLLAKGVNHRQGYDRSPKDLRCVFKFGKGDAVTTSVTVSVQEVFRCPHPDPSQLGFDSNYEVTLEIIGDQNIMVPSVAYYTPRPISKPKPNIIAIREAEAQPKYFLCACTMVYNVAKFLREWVMYHSKVGVENFLLYDNGSDDDFEGVVKELREEGYNISTLLWIWPKTQEAGFSHSILYSKSKGMCTWMMYVDVDEFVYSPSWEINNKNETRHGKHDSFPSLKSMLPRQQHSSWERGMLLRRRIGQVSIMCLEFGPSGQRQHPIEGVTQGYTCRRKVEQRHKSIVLVDAVDKSLWNVIHHFQVNEKEGFWSKNLGVEEGLVNHYKYQAWDEFKSKFRRRVSAYVVDWRQNVNPTSKDRTPGLGFEAVEPKDWTHRFCEVRDQRLKMFVRSWFGSFTPTGYRLAWQSS